MLKLQKRKVHLLGCLFYLWMIMASPSTRVLSRMQYACDVAGSCKYPYQMQLWHNIHNQPCISCPMGGFPTVLHNKLCDITASLLSEVCHNVATEPSPTSQMTNCTAPPSRHSAREDSGLLLKMHIDLRVFLPNAQSNNSGSISAPTTSMRASRNGLTASEWCWARGLHSPRFFHHSPHFFHQREPRHFIGWQICFPGNWRNHTLLSHAGWGASSHLLQSYGHDMYPWNNIVQLQQLREADNYCGKQTSACSIWGWHRTSNNIYTTCGHARQYEIFYPPPHLMALDSKTRKENWILRNICHGNVARV